MYVYVLSKRCIKCCVVLNMLHYQIIRYVTLSNLKNYYAWKNIGMSYEINKFKLSPPT